MLPFASRTSAGTVPIVPVDKRSLPAWLAGQSKTVRVWVGGSGFIPSSGRVLSIPGEGGKAKLVLMGRGDGGPYVWAGAASRLTPGRYRIEGDLGADEATEAAIGWGLEHYAFGRYRKGQRAPSRRELVWPVSCDRAEASRVIAAFAMVRDLINTPAADLGPEELAEIAQKVGRDAGAKTKIVIGDALAREYPLVHAVGRGSDRAPRLFDLSWGDPGAPKISIVGKGVCFDSGGLDLKNAAGMLRMKKDMAGAAIALGLAQMIMDAKLPVRLRVLIPMVENLPGPGAYRPLDVLRSRKGLSIEVTNTDAEGRLILADALAEADREKPSLLIDVATLTGAARLALGTEITAFFSTDKKLADDLSRVSRNVRDPMWRLPLHKAYRRHLESRVADLKNAPSMQLAGAILAALFLREFVSSAEHWMHFDVFGWNDNTKPGRPAGGEATSMRAIWALLRERHPPTNESARPASKKSRGNRR